MEDSGWQYIGSPQIEQTHNHRRKESQQGIDISAKDKTRQMGKGKHETHGQNTSCRVSDPVLQEPPEIYFLRKRDAEQLKEDGAGRQKGK